MNQNSIFAELLNKLKGDHRIMRKLKIFLGVALVGFMLVCALVIWGGVATVRQVASFGANPKVQEKVTALGSEIKNLPALAKVGCWEKAQTLMNVAIWIEKPVADNFKELTQACSGKTSTI